MAMKFLERVQIPEQAVNIQVSCRAASSNVLPLRSLSMGPEVMLFDEPTSALDRNGSKSLMLW